MRHMVGVAVRQALSAAVASVVVALTDVSVSLDGLTCVFAALGVVYAVALGVVSGHDYGHLANRAARKYAEGGASGLRTALTADFSVSVLAVVMAFHVPSCRWVVEFGVVSSAVSLVFGAYAFSKAQSFMEWSRRA